MRAYRLVKTKYASDPLSPVGAKTYGGRWNSKGTPAVYLAGSIALAALEKLVHLHHTEIFSHFMLCELVIPNDEIMVLRERDLPKDWREEPAPASTMAIGDEWLQKQDSLALRVPGTVIPQEYNYVINPEYSAFSDLEETLTKHKFLFDPRLAK